MSCYSELESSVDGLLFEEKVLGTCTCSFDGYRPYQVAVVEVKEHQPSTELRNPAMRKLHNLVCEALQIKHSELSFYTAVGSPLDVYHGIDGFFEWQGFAVTIDLKKSDYCKSNSDVRADICLTGPTLYCNIEGDEINFSALKVKAMEIARTLKGKKESYDSRQQSYQPIVVETVKRFRRRKVRVV